MHVMMEMSSFKKYKLDGFKIKSYHSSEEDAVTRANELESSLIVHCDGFNVLNECWYLFVNQK